MADGVSVSVADNNVIATPDTDPPGMVGRERERERERELTQTPAQDAGSD